jgi:hypothetical protein
VGGLSAATVAELWAHARELAEVGTRELSPPHVRRALVTLAVAGAGGDDAGYEREVLAVAKAFRTLGLDPVPLFDAASALVAEDDIAARAALVNLPRREASPARPFNLRG